MRYLPWGSSARAGASLVVASITWAPGEAHRDRALFAAIPMRRSNPRPYEGRGITMQERAQLQAVTLVSRELAHRLNNDLALAVGIIDLLRDEPALTPELRAAVEDAAGGLERVSAQLGQLQRLARFQTRETPVGRALDLDRSMHPYLHPTATDP